ncbi:solute symporter family protein [Streptomyces olivochromogenes]|uniref:solute symporter family protein n=1 Tax=Streptomyces olivochromogenes TaxID=1963 RepID=UPI001F42902A|nr:cation acetate symporter [Streptomyces olivochromogenes]MCF3131063.1 cation acetate symporter [Streptomyces olivochromogenes]
MAHVEFPALAASSTEPNRALILVLFLVFVAATLAVTVWAGRRSGGAAEFYAGGSSFTGFQNGLAISGDYMSAASFLGITGSIALFGYDGFLYSIGFLVAWLVALLLVAEPLRNVGRFTMADVLAFRMRRRPVRTAAGVSTIVVSVVYLVAQMVGAGSLVALLLGASGEGTKRWIILGVGALMVLYVCVGGMRGTTWVQIIKAVMLIACAALLSVLVMHRFGWSLSALLGGAADASGHGHAFLEPGLKYGANLSTRLDFISLALALVLGTAGLPHILVRFYTVPTARAARTSVNWAIVIIGAFYLMTIALGFGAAALIGPKTIAASNPAGTTAAPMLAKYLGDGSGSTTGAVLLAVVSAVAFATILAVVAGLTLASSASFAHDLYAHVLRKGEADERSEVAVARWAAVVIGAIAIVLSLYADKLNTAALVALAFAVAASANVPTLLYSLFWRKFTTRGALFAVYGGLATSLGLVIFSPVVSGGPTAMLPDLDFAWFPLENPGLVSIPAGFVLGWLGTVLSPAEERDEDRFKDLQVRSLTGIGAR